MPSEGVMILGALAAFFFCMMVLSAGLKLYFKKKAEEDEANSQMSSTWSPAPSAASPGPAAASDILTEREKLIQGTSEKPGGKPIQVAEVDINVVSPPSIPNPFTINSGQSADVAYTISFDIKVEKNTDREEAFTVLDRGGTGDDGNGRRPMIQLKTTATEDFTCTTQYASKNDCPSGQRRTYYRDHKNNSIKFKHKPSLNMDTDVGPQNGQDYKNCTIVVRPTGDNMARVKIYWDAVVVAESEESFGADWGNLSSGWRWGGGQTTVMASIGYVKIKNAYIFGRELDDDEVAVLLGRGSSATSTYVAEPAKASWKFNPSGYESD